jgi:cation:H+ antiporter
MLVTVAYLVGLAVGVAILVKSADWFTDAAIEVARRFRIPEIIVGATLVSLGTTLPEFAVSVTAAVVGKTDMAVGNAVGSTICNVGLILGLCAALSPMGVERKGFLTNGSGLLFIGTAFAVLGYVFPEGSRWTGAVMIGCLCFYIVSTLRAAMAHRAETAGVEEAPHEGMSGGRIALMFLVGAVGVAGGSKLMVYCAEHIALRMGMSEAAIALTIVALGTSTPELVVSLTAIVKKKRGLSIGNVIGANILNLAWVMGVCSLITPLPLVRRNLIFDLPTMVVMSTLLLVFGITGQKLSRWEGIVLFVLYAAYFVTGLVFFGTSGEVVAAVTP